MIALNKFLRKLTAAAVAVMLSASMAVTAGAWSEDPSAAETEATTVAETTAPETTAETTTEETTTTTTAPEAVLDDEPVEPEETEPAETAPATEAETAPPETEAPPATTTAAATTQAAANTVAPDSYSAVDPFEMYVPEVLNVRGGPGTNYDKLGQVYANNTIRIIGTSGEWYVFDYFGNDGYLLAELLQEVPETTTTTAAPEDAPAEDTSEEITTTLPDDDMVIETDASEATTTTEAPVATTTQTEEEEAPAGNVDSGENSGSGFPPILLALICAVAAFLLIGVVPVLVHKAHHKKLYQY